LSVRLKTLSLLGLIVFHFGFQLAQFQSLFWVHLAF
jgi:hypothetical protein